MKAKFRVILTCLMAIASTFVHAQQHAAIINGKITDLNLKALDLATVALFRSTDSLLVKTVFTEADGKFSFDKIAAGSYQLRVLLVGYASYRGEPIIVVENSNTIDLGNIKLAAATETLKEVNIVAKKPFVERKIDRTVVNVDALISNAGTSALDVLEKSPGVSIDQNGNISLKGKQGVVVFIDDKPSYLSGTDLENYLKSLPSSMLDQIELMTNPPAKYDAAGNAGVINIKTKKDKAVGFNGSLNLSLNQGKLSRSNDSFNFNYRKNKFNFFGNFGYNLNNSFTDLDLNRKYKNPDESVKYFFNQNSYFRRHGDTFNGRAGFDFYQSDFTTWGVVLKGNVRNANNVNNNTSSLFNPAMVKDSSIVAKNMDDIDFRNGGINANYRHQFGKTGKEITVDADYINYNSQTDQQYFNDTFLGNGQLKAQDLLEGHLPGRINIYSLKSDYSQSLTKVWKLDAGVKTSYIKTNNIASYFYTTNHITVPDYDKSNHFIYSENISAAYLNLSKEGKRFSVQAGLRLEGTISKGNQLGNIMKSDSSFKRSYLNAFPTLYFSYKLDTLSIHQLGLNYGRRIDRPFYQDLNPFYSPLDKFTYYVGNPFLKPSFTQTIELSHTYKNKITTALSYNYTKDQVNETIEIVDGTYYSRPANIGKQEVYNASIDANTDMTKWLSLHWYGQYTYIHSQSDFYTGFLNTKGGFFSSNGNLQLKFNKGWSGELNYRYQSRLRNVQFELANIYDFGLAVQKKLTTSTTLKLSATDIFQTRAVNGIINNLNLTEANWRNRGDFTTVIFSLNYRFGKAINNLRKHNADGAQTEQNRVKN
ncbi:outer membrane beta-barrel protein [Pedobacter sp. ASV28]|uniref:outer membrane beta-barrel protein n=1 Tax=Pedobacter sp. ASV28 TaxID=2795123 RepID=UPI0018EC6129|nr:outer membrane beta-barrel protein [Pedobacter sp. ASV28]